MRFLPNGPDVPDELINLQEKGQTIFVCGAGVSRTVGLPLFRGLVDGVYQHLSEDWRLHIAEREGMRQGGALEGQYDRVLRCLERRLAGLHRRNRGMRERIRAAVGEVLKPPPPDVDLENHLALIELDSVGDVASDGAAVSPSPAVYHPYLLSIQGHPVLGIPAYDSNSRSRTACGCCIPSARDEVTSTQAYLAGVTVMVPITTSKSGCLVDDAHPVSVRQAPAMWSSSSADSSRSESSCSA
jgi:hypothetical protein